MGSETSKPQTEPDDNAEQGQEEPKLSRVDMTGIVSEVDEEQQGPDLEGRLRLLEKITGVADSEGEGTRAKIEGALINQTNDVGLLKMDQSRAAIIALFALLLGYGIAVAGGIGSVSWTQGSGILALEFNDLSRGTATEETTLTLLDARDKFVERYQRPSGLDLFRKPRRSLCSTRQIKFSAFVTSLSRELQRAVIAQIRPLAVSLASIFDGIGGISPVSIPNPLGGSPLATINPFNGFTALLPQEVRDLANGSNDDTETDETNTDLTRQYFGESAFEPCIIPGMQCDDYNWAGQCDDANFRLSCRSEFSGRECEFFIIYEDVSSASLFTASGAALGFVPYIISFAIIIFTACSGRFSGDKNEGRRSLQNTGRSSLSLTEEA